MAESSMTTRESLTSSDTRRRVWAIIGASSGNWWNGLTFMFIPFALSTSHIFFPRRKHHHSITANSRCIRRRFSDATHWRLVVWSHR